MAQEDDNTIQEIQPRTQVVEPPVQQVPPPQQQGTQPQVDVTQQGTAGSQPANATQPATATRDTAATDAANARTTSPKDVVETSPTDGEGGDKPKEEETGGLVGAMQDWVSKGLGALSPEGLQSAAQDGMAKLGELMNSPEFAKIKDQVMGLPVVATIGGLNSLMGKMKEEGLTAENLDQLNKLLKDSQQFLKPEYLEAARRAFPGNEQLSEENIEKMKGDLAQKATDLSIIYRVTAAIAGENGQLDTGDVAGTINSLMRDPEFRNQIMRSAHDALSQIAKGPLREAIGHRLLNRFSDVVMDLAPDELIKGGKTAMRKLGMAEGSPDGKRRDVSFQDLRDMLAASQRLTGQPPQSLESVIHQQLTHKLRGGGDMTAGQLQQQLGQQGQQAIDNDQFLNEHDAARAYVNEVFQATLGTLPQRLHTAGPRDVLQLWTTAYNAWSLLDKLQPTQSR